MKNPNLQQKFNNQEKFRKRLVEDVKYAYDQDVYIPAIFWFFQENFDSWCCKTACKSWGGDVEICLITLLYKIEIIIINRLFMKQSSTELLLQVGNQELDQSLTRNFKTGDKLEISHHVFNNIKNANLY